MGYLIDTNIISELAKPRPDVNVLNWADGISLVNLSVVTVEELQFGLTLIMHKKSSSRIFPSAIIAFRRAFLSVVKAHAR